MGNTLGLWKYDDNDCKGAWLLLCSSSMYMLVILLVLILNLVV